MEQILPAGLMNKDGEFFTHDNEPFLLTDSSVSNYDQFPEAVKNSIRIAMQQRPEMVEAYRKHMGHTSHEALAKQFIICNYGGFDKVPDVINGELQDPEYWACPDRPTCSCNGIGCCSLKTATGKSLTARETEILELIGTGHLDKEIAGLLEISDKTVTTHNKNIRIKTGLSRKADLTRFAIQKNLI